MDYHSSRAQYVAKVLRTGQVLFSAPAHDLKNESHCWYNMDDGSHRDCAMVMDNRQFWRMLKNGEVEFLKTGVDKNQLSLSI